MTNLIDITDLSDDALDALLDSVAGETATKTTTTTVTREQLIRAQEGCLPSGDLSRVTVVCPVDYASEEITAEDIVCDSAITVVSEEG